MPDPKSAASLAHVTSSEWSKYGVQIFLSRKPPPLGSVAIEDMQELMRKRFEQQGWLATYNYLVGSAGVGDTLVANRRAFQRWKIVPRMLRDATHRDISVELFGKRLPAPVAIAPIGCQGIFHKDGETGTARGAAKLGLPYCMSTVSTRPLSQIAAASGSSPHWFQLYWPDSHELAESILSRVDQAGFDVLLLTVDTMMLGWRPKDLIVEDPIFNKQNNLTPSQDFGPFPFDHVASAAKYHAGNAVLKPRVDLSIKWMSQINNGSFKTWERLPEIRQLWKKPILLKGILHVEDALLALDAGVDGIVVSNHGARQLDGAVSSLTALARICEHPRIRAAQGSGKFTVLLDSGIRSGVDILKAITLGAKAVLIGRPCMYGLALAGEEGVESILRCLLADFETSLGLSGYKNIAEIWDKHDAVLIQDNT